MKHFFTFLALLACLCGTRCGTPRAASTDDFTVETYTPQFAAGFTLRGTPDGRSTLLTVHNPWQSAEGVEQRLFIARDDEEAPAGFDGQVVRAPVRHAVCMSSSHVAMFDILGEIRRVSGVSGIDYITNPYVQEHRHCGEVRDVGYDTGMNFELLAAMQPDIVLLYGVAGENGAVTSKLRELEIPYVYVGDHVEESPLGKAEWLVAAAELCNRREHGCRVFEGIRTRYEALRDEAAAQRAARPAPCVMLNTPYRDTWFMPPVTGYMVRLIEDAGGRYVYARNTTGRTVPIDIEEAYLLASEADLWLNAGAYPTLDALTADNPKFADIPAVRKGLVYNNDRRATPAGGSDFWESGAVCPDRILRDLIRIFADPNADSELHYYRKLRPNDAR